MEWKQTPPPFWPHLSTVANVENRPGKIGGKKIDKNLRITAADLHDKEADVAIQISEGVWISNESKQSRNWLPVLTSFVLFTL